MRTIVILLSDKRSGSTMLEKELCKHSGINHVPYTPHTYNETHYWLKAACLLPTPDQLFTASKRYKGYGSKPSIRKSLIKTIQGNVPDFVVPDDDESLVFDGWEALCNKFANPVFFEKSPQHPHHWAALDLMLRWSESTNFKVKFIGLVRNPLSVMYSAQQLFFTNPEDRQFPWASAYRNILLFNSLVSNDLFLFIRYEDLIENPRKHFGDVCDFIGVAYEENIGASVHGNSINKWQQDKSFSLKLHDSVIRTAKSCGYSREELENIDGQSISSLYRIKTRIKFRLKRTRMRLINRIKLLIKV